MMGMLTLSPSTLSLSKERPLLWRSAKVREEVRSFDKLRTEGKFSQPSMVAP